MNGILFSIANCTDTHVTISNECPAIAIHDVYIPSDRLMDLFVLLGLDYSEYTGDCDGRTLYRAIERLFDMVVMCEPLGCPSMSDQDAIFYLLKMDTIARHAERLEERVIWS